MITMKKSVDAINPADPETTKTPRLLAMAIDETNGLAPLRRNLANEQGMDVTPP